MENLPHILTFYDIILGPIYFLLLLLWVYRWKKKYYKNSPLKKYIIPAFVFKIICCILIAFLYEFYYRYGDIHNYYTGASEVWNATKVNPRYGFELVFKSIENCSPEAREFTNHFSDPVFVASIVNMFKISGFIGMFCFGTYLPIAMVISLLSFIGSWKILTVFVNEFPVYYKKLAIACLFVPSFVLWGTNILKDPLCIFGLGLCISALYNLMKTKISFFILAELFLGAFILLSLKSYIFYLFCVAAFWSVYVNFVSNSKIKYKILIRLAMFLVLGLGIIGALIARDYLAEVFSNGFVNDVTVIQNVQQDMGGSVYVIPNVDDGSFFGIIRTYLLSLNVALFRPYLWEIPNFIAILSALESLTVLFFTLYLLIKLKIVGFFTTAFTNRVLTFAFIFTLLMAPLAGLVSFNFGTLARYKIPFVPFYYSYLVILYERSKKIILLNKNL